jgi:hypothetical protein
MLRRGGLAALVLIKQVQIWSFSFSGKKTKPGRTAIPANTNPFKESGKKGG